MLQGIACATLRATLPTRTSPRRGRQGLARQWRTCVPGAFPARTTFSGKKMESLAGPGVTPPGRARRRSPHDPNLIASTSGEARSEHNPRPALCVAHSFKMPQVNTGSLYRCGERTRAACGIRQEERGPEICPKTMLARRNPSLQGQVLY